MTRCDTTRAQLTRARRGSPTPPKPPTEGLPRALGRHAREAASRAYTLVEMLVVISITSLVLTSVAVALHVLFGVERHLRRDLATETVRARLDVLLREDAHRASAVEAVTRDGETIGLIFMLPNEHRVEYRTEAGRILRVAQTGDKVLHRELFRLGDGTRVEWTIEREQALAIACVMLSRTPGQIEAAKNASRTDRLEALVGLDTTHSRTRPGG